MAEREQRSEEVTERREGGPPSAAGEVLLGSGPEAALQLQRLAGNRALTELLRRRGGQRQGPGWRSRPGTRSSAPLQRLGGSAGQRRQPIASGGSSSTPGRPVASGGETRTPLRTVAVIHIEGEASPRWRSAGSASRADQLNLLLSEQRARAVGTYVEHRLGQLLAGRELVFVVDDATASPSRPGADVLVEEESEGSTQTLREAGSRGRSANDPGMRRVDVQVDLHESSSVEQTESTWHEERRSTATRDWGLWMAGQEGFSAIGTVGAVQVVLRNLRTGAVAPYIGWYGGFKVGAGLRFSPTVSEADFHRFQTPEPMSFSDFDWCRFAIAARGVSVVGQVKQAEFRFLSFQDKPVVSSAIDLSGASIGGIGVNFGSGVVGTLSLVGHPPQTEETTVRQTRASHRTENRDEASTHRVLFRTGGHAIAAAEARSLDEYLAGVAAGYER